MSKKIRIPKKLHVIWVGDDNKRPAACIESWRRQHPDWEFRLWTDRDLEERDWINERHLRTFVEARVWPGVADLMRYEILYLDGGVYVDADSLCLRPLDDWLLEGEMFACWESMLNERRGSLVSNAFLGSVPNNPFMRYVIDAVGAKKQVLRRWSWGKMRYTPLAPWRSVGPALLTKCIHDYNGDGYNDISVLPSHMFCPRHYHGRRYNGQGVVYADHQWANTRGGYDAAVEQQKATGAVLQPALQMSFVPSGSTVTGS